MKDRVRRLLKMHPALRYKFILIELETGITYCRAAAATKHDERKQSATEQAKQASKAALDLADGRALKNMPREIRHKHSVLEALLTRLQRSHSKNPFAHRNTTRSFAIRQ